MKSTGIVRKVDELGRVVIPIELRRVLSVGIKDPLEIYTDSDAIILKKYVAQKECMITGEIDQENIELANGKLVLSKEGLRILLGELTELKRKSMSSL